MTDPITHEIARLRIWAQGRELTREQYAADTRAASEMAEHVPVTVTNERGAARMRPRDKRPWTED